jgi:diguanylate cyclase (GGDEF)-like protein
MEQVSGEGRIAGTTVALLVRMVRDLAGDAGVRAMLDVAGERRSIAVLEDVTVWSPYESVIRLFVAGSQATGESELGRLVGEQMLLQYRGTEVAALLRSLGSPGEVLRNVAESATKFSTATALEAVEIADESAIVEAWAVEGLERHRVMCDYTAGVLSEAPVLFGMEPAEVTEENCQARGDRRCRYVVRWDASSAPEASADRRIAFLEEQLSTLTDRFEALQATATELVSADDAEQLLRAIVKRAALAVRATQYVLAVRLSPSDSVRVEHRGFEDGEPPPSLVTELLSDTSDVPLSSRLIVDVATARQRFGRLAAICPPGSRFLPDERRLLQAYAANAAAALEAAAALDESRRRQETAATLLHLATAIAEVAEPQEMAQRIAEAIPRVVGGERATVMVWDEVTEQLRFCGFAGLDATVVEALSGISVSTSDTPALGGMLADHRPMFIDEANEDPFLDALLELGGVAAAVAVPMVAGDRFFGVVTAELAPEGREARDDLLERLAGVAAQGATALQNARLVEQLREQSLHDPLTGLPNRTLLRDRVDQALVRAARSGERPVMLFVDLDHFKVINDTFGHAIGDAVLCIVADRLRGAVRTTDTVARIGGDEFAVLLDAVADPADAQRLAGVLLDQVRDPVVAGGHRMRVSASIGVVTADATQDHDRFLSRADSAMYDAKAGGRDTAVLA